MPNASQDHLRRRDTIRQLLQRAPAATQQSLVDALQKRGFAATQSSVSRDLRELGAVKSARGYVLPAQADNDDAMAGVAGLIREVTPAGSNLIVIRTGVGAAQRVALALDRSNWPEMIGNIGGDDTVFVATDSAYHQKLLIAKIERIRA